MKTPIYYVVQVGNEYVGFGNNLVATVKEAVKGDMIYAIQVCYQWRHADAMILSFTDDQLNTIYKENQT